MAIRRQISCDQAVALSESLHPNSAVSPALAVWASRDRAYPIFLRHLEECVTCRISVGVKRRIREPLPEVTDELQQRRLLDDVIAVARSERKMTDAGSFKRGVSADHSRRRLIVSVAAGFLIFAGLGWGIMWYAIWAIEGKHRAKSVAAHTGDNGERGEVTDAMTTGRVSQEWENGVNALRASGGIGNNWDRHVNTAGNRLPMGETATTESLRTKRSGRRGKTVMGALTVNDICQVHH